MALMKLRPYSPRISLAQLDARDLRQRVGFVRRLQRAGQQRALRDRLRREFRINARAAEEEQLLRAEIVRRLDEVVLDAQILEQELDGKIVVRLDAADFRRRDHDDLRTPSSKNRAHALQPHKSTSARVRVTMRVAVRLQFAQDRAARQAAVAGDKNRF